MPRRCTRTAARSIRQTGFNLIELMVVVAIVGIGLTIAAPSFSDAMARNRVASQANEFMAGVNYARSEAIRLGSISGICASNDRTTCSGNWSDGWLVWSDANRDGAFSAGEVMRIGIISPKDRLTTATALPQVQFDRRGLVRATILNDTTPEATLTLRPATCATGKPFQRTLTVTLTGQVRMTQGNCP